MSALESVRVPVMEYPKLGVLVGAAAVQAVSVEVGVLVGVEVGGTGTVLVGVLVMVGVSVTVGVSVMVAVGVTVAVSVTVDVNVEVFVKVGVPVGVLVLVTVAVLLGVPVEVLVAVLVGVPVEVGVQVWPEPSVQTVLVGAGADGEEGLLLLGQPIIKKEVEVKRTARPKIRNFMLLSLVSTPAVKIGRDLQLVPNRM